MYYTIQPTTNLTRKMNNMTTISREGRRISGGRSTSTVVRHSASQSAGLRLAVSSSQEERGHSSPHPGMGSVTGSVVVVVGVMVEGVVLW